MREHNVWSLDLGRWAGVQVRLHMLFLLFAAFALYFAWGSTDPGGMPGIGWLALLSLGVLLASVLVHEMGHLAAARRLGGAGSRIVLGPFGGIGTVAMSQEPRAQLLTHLAGPAANLAVCCLCGPALLIVKSNLLGLLHPLNPVDLTVGSGVEVLLKLVFWINWSLVLVNLLPAYPLDAASALQSALLLRWPALGPHAASWIVARVAQLVALAILLGALLWKDDPARMLVPIRVSLILLGILLFFIARQPRSAAEETDEAPPARDEDAHLELGELERGLEESGLDADGPLRRWVERRRRMRTERLLEIEAEEERQVDAILARVHAQGLDGLSPAERSLLDRVSARYRSRSSR